MPVHTGVNKKQEALSIGTTAQIGKILVHASASLQHEFGGGRRRPTMIKINGVSMEIDSSYDSFAYHDNLVHGIRFIVEGFRSEVVFDIDHIVSWPLDCDPGGESVFKVAKCDLCFTDVTDFESNYRLGAKWLRNRNFGAEYRQD